jgi:hypothetical protein
MPVKTDPKDEITERLRQMVTSKVPMAQETDEAEALLSALSFQSTSYPERHIWIDTDLEEISIDLEDWNIEGEWDNAVARLKVESLPEAVDIAQAWLSGVNLDKLLLGRRQLAAK